jgi:hypothetical protein
MQMQFSRLFDIRVKRERTWFGLGFGLPDYHLSFFEQASKQPYK